MILLEWYVIYIFRKNQIFHLYQLGSFILDYHYQFIIFRNPIIETRFNPNHYFIYFQNKHHYNE